MTPDPNIKTERLQANHSIKTAAREKQQATSIKHTAARVKEVEAAAPKIDGARNCKSLLHVLR